MTASTPTAPVDFRLNTAEEIACLNTETLLDHLAELDAARRPGKPVEAAWTRYAAEINKQREAGEFRLNTAAEVGRLCNGALASDMAEMEKDRLRNAGTDDWFLLPVHPTWGLYSAEATARSYAGDTFWPEGSEYVPLADGDDLPF